MRGFADHMDTEAFNKTVIQLMHLDALAPTVIMCAERLPEACHRYLIADYLVLKNIEILHIVDKDRMHPHLLNPSARRESLEFIYDRNTTEKLENF